VAVLYHPARQTTLKLLYGEAFRVPNVYELIYEDAGTGFKRSSGLRPEQIRTHEAVWEQRVGASVFGSASLYHYRMRDLIDTRVDPADSLLQFANVALVISTGATLALDARFPGGSQAYVSYAYQHSQDGSTRQNLTNSPLHIAKAGASAPLGANALVSTEMRYESARRTVQGGTAGAHLWTGLHLLVGRGHVRRSADGGFLRNTDLSVTVANVFDARFGTPGGFEHLQTTIPQDGRTVSARLRMWL
jgi:iron complex outermembrane receptor protein